MTYSTFNRTKNDALKEPMFFGQNVNVARYDQQRHAIFEKLIEKRGQLINKSKKIDSKNVVEELEKGKKYEELNLKPFFRLHPPRKGIKSKFHFPKGVLGNNKDKINELMERML